MPQDISIAVIIISIFIVVAVLIPASVRIIKEYERGVVLRWGRFKGIRTPGIKLLIPFVDQMLRVDLRVVTMDVPKQEMMTRDNVPVTVDAVVYFKIVNPEDAMLKVENFVKANSMIAQTTLRSTVGQAALDDLLSERDKINEQLQKVIDQSTEPWGVVVTNVEVRDVILPETMKRAMAGQAEAERERRAKIINAEGEYQASEKLAQAAEIIGKHPTAIQLRYLQTLTTVAAENNSTTLFPIPIDLFTPFIKNLRDKAEEESKG